MTRPSLRAGGFGAAGGVDVDVVPVDADPQGARRSAGWGSGRRSRPARCSTDAQDLTAQRQRLAELGVAEDRICIDHGLTGTSRERPGLDQALAAARADGRHSRGAQARPGSPAPCPTPAPSATTSPPAGSSCRSAGRSTTPPTRAATRARRPARRANAGLDALPRLATSPQPLCPADHR